MQEAERPKPAPCPADSLLWEVLLGLAMYLRMGFRFRSSTAASFSFLPLLLCGPKKGRGVSGCPKLGWVGGRTTGSCAFQFPTHLLGLGEERQPLVLLLGLLHNAGRPGLPRVDAHVDHVGLQGKGHGGAARRGEGSRAGGPPPAQFPETLPSSQPPGLQWEQRLCPGRAVLGPEDAWPRLALGQTLPRNAKCILGRSPGYSPP